MKKKFLKGLFYLLLGYLLLVAIHFIYLELNGEAYVPSDSDDYKSKEQVVQMELPAAASSAVRNYATAKFAAARGDAVVEQKYEKIASVSAATGNYEEDQLKARTAVKTHNALIQEEAVNNYNGRNVLDLTIGVPPGAFDAIVADLKNIGQVLDFHITKTDKTNDFLQLKAKRATLEKARDALIALKAQGGKIEELVKLEQEVLSLEDKIQGFGVQLGQFDQVNEFCTVRFSLVETKGRAMRSPHMGYLIASIAWASNIYLLWLGIASVGLIVIVLLLIIVEKAKLFRGEA